MGAISTRNLFAHRSELPSTILCAHESHRTFGGSGVEHSTARVAPLNNSTAKNRYRKATLRRMDAIGGARRIPGGLSCDAPFPDNRGKIQAPIETRREVPLSRPGECRLPGAYLLARSRLQGKRRRAFQPPYAQRRIPRNGSSRSTIPRDSPSEWFRRPRCNTPPVTASAAMDPAS